MIYVNCCQLGSLPVLHSAFLLRIILRVMSARAFANAVFFFTTGLRRRGDLSFFFCCFELSSKFLYVKFKYGPILRVERNTIVGNVNLGYSWCYYKGLYGVNKVLLLLNECQGSKFTFDFGSTCATRCKFFGALPKF